MSPPPPTTDRDLVEHLLGLFRRHGYSGTSLRMIAEQTGLQRSSLYHRFPGGKQEMAAAVMDHVDGWFIEHVVGPLRGSEPPASRVQRMTDALQEFYAGGTQPCVLDTLSLGTHRPVGQRVQQSLLAWRAALQDVAVDAGAPAQEATVRADDALVQIEGALVYARATGDTRPFARTLDRLVPLLTG